MHQEMSHGSDMWHSSMINCGISKDKCVLASVWSLRSLHAYACHPQLHANPVQGGTVYFCDGSEGVSSMPVLVMAFLVFI